ncbi:MAG: primosomal protein N' [candidate division WOR-3 bacterium]|nr:primosomal protein N' [candidate division WOR-3 bacterium]
MPGISSTKPMSMLVDVAIPNTKFDYLTYQTDLELHPGDLVLVPLKKKIKYGIVISTNVSRSIPNIKEVHKLVEANFIPIELLNLYRWIADYYVSYLGEVLKQAFPPRVLKKFEYVRKDYEKSALVKEPTPTYHQAHAINRILYSIKRNIFKVFLLFGVTGSGKTEVYLRVVAEVLKNGGRALVLVPEISMTPLLLKRFNERFGNEVITIHSGLTEKERRHAWYGIKKGVYKIIIGPRSAVFLPISNLKVIIVDEEHDHSYKEHQQAVKYNARDVAVVRAKIENITVVLGSATPQIESYYNAGMGKYELLVLKERIDSRPLPCVEMVDLKKERKKFISSKLEKAIEEVLQRDEQAILFLNRRGFAPSLLCPNCGYVVKCPYCRLPMVYHRAWSKDGSSILSCHTCDYKIDFIKICPNCGRATLLYRGAGIQRIEEMIRKILKEKIGPAGKEPADYVLRLDRDVARKRGEAEKILQRFEEQKAKILLGTQLVTKGFDFPNVTFVGIVNADTILNLPDFRSGEKTFQILTQVAGRAGRGEKPGTVLIQTYHPEQYSILFSQLQNYPKFYAEEMKLRKELNFPPFSRLVLVRLSGKNEQSVWEDAKRVCKLLDEIKGINIFGPNQSFYYKIRNNYRVYILIKAPLKFDHRRLKFLRQIKLNRTKLEIDVDPIDVF